jgi:ADP-heptose:LPS heptosyltransferase/glycosyltransferase involved in cell wall biosynthesis
MFLLASDQDSDSGSAMSLSSPRVSLVVSTMNRTEELAGLMDSLLGQEFKDFEILVVDQNSDDRIVPVLERYQSELNISRIPTSGRTGVSSGRNDGWRRARGDFIVFPDDDCWYPPWFLRRGLQILDSSGAELVCGRFADETGRTINGRFASRAHYITPRSVWIAQAEWVTFHRRGLLERLGGFDEGLGIGSSSHWQAAEGPDFILRALEHYCVCYYDPSLYGFHREYDLDNPAGGMARKGRVYGRGMGYVLRRHRYGVLNLLYWASRPLATAFISVFSGRFYRALYSLSVSVGRIEGWTGWVWTGGKSADAIVPNSGRSTTSAASYLDRQNVGSRVSFGKKRREMTGPYRARNPLLVGALYAIDSLARLLPTRKGKVEENRTLRVLVANWGHLGDLVSILPLLQYLERHPRVNELGVLIGSWSGPILEATNLAARIHIIDHWALDRGNKSSMRKFIQYLMRRTSLVRELRQCRYDISIDTFASFPSSHGITWSAFIPRRVGFTCAGLGPCLTDQFSWFPDNKLMLNHQLRLLEPLLGEFLPKSLAASYPGFDSEVPEDLLGVGTDPYIVIHMGPKSFRGWVPEKWVLLAATLKERGYNLVATGGAGSEMESAQQLSEKVSVRNLSGRLSWGQFVATVANAAGIVTIDSVTGHVAACFGVPTVVLAAGRQRISLWRPNNANAIMLTHQVGCAPCHRTRGCAAMACVRRIDVGDVLSSLELVMKMRRGGQSDFMSGASSTPS